MSRGPLSLVSVSTGTATGTTVALRKPCRAFGIVVTVANSTKASVRAQGSVDGLTWTDLGAQATTFAASGQFGSTSAIPYSFARVKQTAMLTKANMSLKASIIGY